MRASTRRIGCHGFSDNTQNDQRNNTRANGRSGIVQVTPRVSTSGHSFRIPGEARFGDVQTATWVWLEQSNAMMQEAFRGDAADSAVTLQVVMAVDMRSACHRCDCTQSALANGTRGDRFAAAQPISALAAPRVLANLLDACWGAAWNSAPVPCNLLSISDSTFDLLASHISDRGSNSARYPTSAF